MRHLNTSNVIPLHRGHITRHELHDHCTPQEQEPTLIDHVRDVAALAIVVGLAGLLWVAAGCPGLHVIGG